MALIISLRSVIVADDIENCYFLTNQLFYFQKIGLTYDDLFLYNHFEKLQLVLFFSC